MRSAKVELEVRSGRDQVLRLADGRNLGWSRFGESKGRPVFYFHGWPGSRVEAEAFEPQALECGAQVIAVDRPGYGLSSPQPGRTLSDWPRDVLELADALGVDRFAVVGVSGGGPYAVACARHIPDRLTSVGVVCGLSPLEQGSTRGMMPLNRALLLLARRAPRVGGWIFDQFARIIAKNPGIVVSSRLTAALPEIDREILRTPLARRVLTGSMKEAFRQGSSGPRHDGLLFARPWGFALSEIAVEVRLWHGELDKNVPVAMGRQLARDIPVCRARFFPDEGHVSLPFRRAEEILGQLVGLSSRATSDRPEAEVARPSRP